MIVYNEESRLENCLLDARDHVDEIVVVDQMSTDRTPEIAERLADVYIRDVHHGHAEPSPELAASRSSGDWILILDADENMSDLLKAQLRQLVAGDKDGYWIRKENLVDGAVTGRVDHLRLVRKSRASFDPGPHGGARSVTENVDTFEQIGILHEKSLGEQIFDDARYEQMAYEEDAPTSSKRNWLQHNYALRAQRGGRRRTDLELLVPAGARAVLVVGDVRVEFEGASVRQVDSVLSTAPGAAVAPAPTDGTFDAAVVVLPAAEPLARLDSLRSIADLVRPGGTIVGTVPAARNRRRVEAVMGSLLSSGSVPWSQSAGGSTPFQPTSERPSDRRLDISPSSGAVS